MVQRSKHVLTSCPTYYHLNGVFGLTAEEKTSSVSLVDEQMFKNLTSLDPQEKITTSANKDKFKIFNFTCNDKIFIIKILSSKTKRTSFFFIFLLLYQRGELHEKG